MAECWSRSAKRERFGVACESSAALMFSRFIRSFVGIALTFFILLSLLVFHPPTRAYLDPWTGVMFGEGGVERAFSSRGNSSVIMAKLENATAKAELGRATWKLMHTMTLRFPENPTEDEREALRSYFYLQSRLYPCGDCAAHFQVLLKEYPPQTSTRKIASLWLCYIHNLINERLEKPEFDCSNLDEAYDCGCGEQAAADGLGDRDDATGVEMIKGGR